jgi:integrase
MANVAARRRKDGMHYQVRWHLGGSRDGPWQSETFTDRRAAGRFKTDVELAGNVWPEGWVKGVGYLPGGADEQEADQPLAEFGAAYIRRLTTAGPGTLSAYQQQLRSLVRWLREVKGVEPTVRNISTNDDKDWINTRRRAGASPKTIANYHGLLYAMLKDATRQGLRANNPCDGVKLPVREDDTEDDNEKVFLTEPEFERLHRCIAADAQDLVLAAVGTGLRWGEITALKVKDLDLEAAVPTLRVRRAWKRSGRGEFAVEGDRGAYLGTPKTKLSRRQITLAPPVATVFRRAVERKGPEDLVFTAPEGGPWNRHNFYGRRWQKAVRAAQAAGLAKRPRFHDLRHSHAAWLISAGVPLPVIQRRLGHHSIQITVDVYGGLLQETHELADAAIARALTNQQVVVALPGAERDRRKIS